MDALWDINETSASDVTCSDFHPLLNSHKDDSRITEEDAEKGHRRQVDGSGRKLLLSGQIVQSLRGRQLLKMGKSNYKVRFQITGERI
jgi:hypothetical protein